MERGRRGETNEGLLHYGRRASFDGGDDEQHLLLMDWCDSLVGS